MPLPIALVLSLAFHLACYTLADWAGLHAQSAPKTRPTIEAMLIVPQMAPVQELVPVEALPVPPPPPTPAPPMAAPAPAQPLPPTPTKRPPELAKVTPPPAPSPVPAPEDSKTLFYPLEAVHRGIEGVVMVSVVIDPAGNVTAAHLERGSGHAILDEAAVRAARTLKNLPVEHHGEATLPVRFKLR